jgi:group I intron endonuclease
MIVYLYTNKINGKQYVGQTIKTLAARWKNQKSSAKNKKIHRHPIDNAIAKYGAETFDKTVLHECLTVEEMDFAEMFYIALLNTQSPNGYNLTGGGVGLRGWKHTPEAKLKMSKAQMGNKKALGRKPSERWIKAMQPFWNGEYKHSPEVKAQMSVKAKQVQAGRTRDARGHYV